MWHAERGRLLLRTPGPVPYGLAYVLLVETNPFSELVVFFRTMLFEYPSVLSRFCFEVVKSFDHAKKQFRRIEYFGLGSTKKATMHYDCMKTDNEILLFSYSSMIDILLSKETKEKIGLHPMQKSPTQTEQ